MAAPASVEALLAQVSAASAARHAQFAAALAERDALRRELAAVAAERDSLRGQLVSATPEELQALVDARDELLIKREAEIAARDAALATARAGHAADLVAASSERAAALAAAGAERAAIAAAAATDREDLQAERRLTRSVLARDATLASALFERDDLRRKVALPGVHAALLGELLLDAVGIVSAVGYAAEVSHCRGLCRLTWRIVQRGDTADMLACSLERQCGAKAAHAAKRENYEYNEQGTISSTTQLIRATLLNHLPRVLQLIQLGAQLDSADESRGYAPLQWASWLGHEHVVKALLDGKYEGRGATVDMGGGDFHSTPLQLASSRGHEAVVRMLLTRGAKVELQEYSTHKTALHYAVINNLPSVVEMMCAAPGAAVTFALYDRTGFTPLALAIEHGHAACEAALRAHGATA